MKNAQVKKELAKTYRELSLVTKDICLDCNGKKGYPNSWSHIISRNRCRQLGNIPLIWDRNNVYRSCQGSSDSCHTIWENGSIEDKLKLLHFIDNLRVMQKYDIVGFRKIMIEIEDYSVEEFNRIANILNFEW